MVMANIFFVVVTATNTNVSFRYLVKHHKNIRIKEVALLFIHRIFYSFNDSGVFVVVDAVIYDNRQGNGCVFYLFFLEHNNHLHDNLNRILNGMNEIERIKY